MLCLSSSGTIVSQPRFLPTTMLSLKYWIDQIDRMGSLDTGTGEQIDLVTFRWPFHLQRVKYQVSIIIVYEWRFCQAPGDPPWPRICSSVCSRYVRKACCEEEDEPVMVNQRSTSKALLDDRNHAFNLGVIETWGRAPSISPVFQAGDNSATGHLQWAVAPKAGASRGCSWQGSIQPRNTSSWELGIGISTLQPL